MDHRLKALIIWDYPYCMTFSAFSISVFALAVSTSSYIVHAGLPAFLKDFYDVRRFRTSSWLFIKIFIVIIYRIIDI